LTKEEFRKKGRKKISNRERRVLSRKVEKKLNRTILKLKNRNILFYFPLQNEIDISKSLLFWHKRRNVFLPKISEKSFSAVRFRLPLKKSKFGTFEPNGKQKTDKIDVAIVPILGIDSSFRRVGFGAGMYDRFFPKLQKKPYTIFIQAHLNFSRKVLTENHDISCDEILFGKSKNYLFGF
jgi:5-formyltetrahydrofolate cyclo-ligase